MTLDKWLHEKNLSEQWGDVHGKWAGFVQSGFPVGRKEYIHLHLQETDPATVAHECLHLVRMIFEQNGMPFRAENDETIAYYLGYWINQINETLAKEGKKGRRSVRGKKS